MKKQSEFLHFLTMISVLAGFASLIGAWFAGEEGLFFGFSQTHLFNDANGLLLLGIALALGTLIHQNLEKKR